MSVEIAKLERPTYSLEEYFENCIVEGMYSKGEMLDGDDGFFLKPKTEMFPGSFLIQMDQGELASLIYCATLGASLDRYSPKGWQMDNNTAYATILKLRTHLHSKTETPDREEVLDDLLRYFGDKLRNSDA